jgi:hypothetical protein
MLRRIGKRFSQRRAKGCFTLGRSFPNFCEEDAQRTRHEVARRVQNDVNNRGAGHGPTARTSRHSRETNMDQNNIDVAIENKEESEERLSIEVPTQIQAGLGAVCTCGPGNCCSCCGVIIIIRKV